MFKYAGLTSIILLLGTLGAPTAKAAQVVFHNGDRLSGTIISMRDARTMYFRSKITGDMRISWESISELYDDDLNMISIPDAPPPLVSPLTGINDSNDNRAVQTWTQSGTTKTMQDVSNARSTSGENTDLSGGEDDFKWSGRVNFGGQIDDGNTKNKAVTFDANIKARDNDNRFNFGGQANWEEEEGEETENDQMVFASYDRFLTDKYFIGGRLQFERDKFEDLDLRSRIRLHNGYQFFERDDLNLQIKAGGEYIHEKFSDDSTESDIAASWGLDYDQKFYENAFQIFHNHGLSVPVSDTDAFLFDSESGIRVPVGKHLTGTAQVDFDWDNAPAPGVREDDTSYSLKLGYEW